MRLLCASAVAVAAGAGAAVATATAMEEVVVAVCTAVSTRTRRLRNWFTAATAAAAAAAFNDRAKYFSDALSLTQKSKACARSCRRGFDQLLPPARRYLAASPL